MKAQIRHADAHPSIVLSRLKPYAEVRNPQVGWLGRIPSHWEVKRLKRLFFVISGSTPLSGISEYWDGDIPWVTPEDLGALDSNEIVATRRLITAEGYESCGTSLVADGSLVLSTRAPIGHLAIAGVPLCTNQGCRSLVFRSPSDRKFFFYQLQALQSELGSLGQGSTFMELGKGKLESVFLVAPPLAEQTIIADFLDRKTTHIDNLIARKMRLIGLLQEKRTALIKRAVLRGLDPTAPTKPSGVDWLGNIPSHWNHKQLKRVSRVFGGGTPAKEIRSFWQGDIPWASPKDMKVSVITETEDKITAQAVESSATKIVPEGSVLIVVRSGILRHTIPVAITGRPMALNQDIKAFVPTSELNPQYLRYMIAGLQKELLFAWKKEGATVESLEMELVSNSPTLLPPISEQLEIVNFLDHEVLELERLMSKVSEAIERLQELREALISAAVTGQIDVRAA